MAKVLYVDPDSARVEAICALFSERGHTVTAASCAERAMMHVERGRDYQVIVAHLVLPSIDGAELCRWLARSSSLAGVPRVVFTSPGVHLGVDLTGGLPRWLPADIYLHCLENLAGLVDAVERLLEPSGE